MQFNSIKKTLFRGTKGLICELNPKVSPLATRIEPRTFMVEGNNVNHYQHATSTTVAELASKVVSRSGVGLHFGLPSQTEHSGTSSKFVLHCFTALASRNCAAFYCTFLHCLYASFQKSPSHPLLHLRENQPAHYTKLSSLD